MDDSKHRTVLIAAFEGWNDAGQAASGAIRHLLKALEVESRQVDRISCSPFFDYQFTRPMMCTVDGRRQIMWPQVTFSSIDLSPSLTLLTELGPEPNFQWMEFAQKSLRIADAYEVDEIITLGSMFNDVPHTRPLPVSQVDSHAVLDPDDAYNGPVGIPSIINFTAAEQGYKTLSMWVSIPQYVGADDCPFGVQTLIDALGAHLGVDLPQGDLPFRTRQWKASADALVSYNDDLNHYVKQLEEDQDQESMEDAMGVQGDYIPQKVTNQLIDETEAFLSSLNGGGKGQDGRDPMPDGLSEGE